MFEIALNPVHSLIVWTFIMAISFAAFVGAIYISTAGEANLSKLHRSYLFLLGLLFLSVSGYCLKFSSIGFKTFHNEQFFINDPLGDPLFLLGVGLEIAALVFIQSVFMKIETRYEGDSILSRFF